MDLPQYGFRVRDMLQNLEQQHGFEFPIPIRQMTNIANTESFPVWALPSFCRRKRSTP